MTRHPELPERDRRILGVLVQAYIDQGEPVSSLWLASRGFGVSSATLRNIMARLEEQGYVRQPHTSAGRVPDRPRLPRATWTAAGRAAHVCGRPAGRSAAAPRRDASRTCCRTCRRRCRAPRTRSGSRSRPPADTTTLEQLDFVPLDGGKVLVVVVAAGGHVSHKVIEPTEEYEHAELQQAANYLNSEFKGRSLLEVRQAVIERLREERTLYDELMARALAAGEHDVRGHRRGADGLHPGHVAPARRCRRRRIPRSRSRRCGRCCE